MLVAALLRLFRLGDQSLWVDEALTWRSAHLGEPVSASWLLENLHGPLFSLLLHAWCGLAGDSEWALRLPSAVLGVLLVPAIAWLGARWLGREVALPAAWLAAGSPFLVWYSQEARNYAMVMLCAVMSSGALLAMRSRIAPGRFAAWLVASLAGLLSNLSFALLAPAQVWWFLGPPGGRARRLVFLAGGALVLVLALLPWLPQITNMLAWSRLHPVSSGELGPPLRGSTTFHPAALPFALHSFAVGYTLGPSLRALHADASWRALTPHLPVLGLELLVFGSLGVLGLRALARRRRLADGLMWLAVPALLVTWFALRNFKVFHPRYLAVAMPGFLILLAAALADLPRRVRWGFAVAVGGLWLASLAHHYFDPAHAKEDERSAAALIRARGVAGETIIAANAEEPLFYYYRGPLPIRQIWLGWVARPERLALGFRRALEGASGAWVVLSRSEELDPKDRLARFIATEHPEARRFSYEGVRVWHIAGDVPRGRATGGAGAERRATTK